MRKEFSFARSWLAVVSLLLSACGGGGGGGVVSTPVPQTLALIMDTPNSSAPTQAALDEATRLALDAGVKGIVVMHTWSELEPAPGQYALTNLQAELARHRQDGLQIYLGIQVINTVKRELPADLQSLAFDDPQVLSRFHDLIDALQPVLSGAERYLSIGNEVDTYLANNPSQWSAYQSFYEDALAYVHQEQPSLQVGVTTGFDGYSSTSVDEVAALNTRSDFIALTYYPMQDGAQVRSPDAPHADFPLMVNKAGGRPVVLQEAGFPSGALNGSSEQSEAQFVAAALDAWKLQGNSMPFLSYFLLYDFDAPTCAAFDAYYGVNDPAFTEFLCSLGLRRADGTEKPAWSSFVTAAHQ
jgi:hypothetical protein